MESNIPQDDKYNNRINYQPSNPTISSLYENYKDGDLILAPDFQRNYVWDKQKASNLIESILLNIPLPLIFTVEIDGSIEEVVDGQQRLTSIFSFIDGTFPNGSPFKLSRKLKILSKEIGGKSYQDLDKEYQKIIKKKSLPVITITKDSQADIKFEMFERLNTNMTTLKEQELRNCLYRGTYNDFLKDMANYSDFQYILNKPDLKKRQRDVELVLMFFAFYHKAPDHYNTNIKQMLNSEMLAHQNDDAEKLKTLEYFFKKSVQLIKHIFGKNAFNIYYVNQNNGYYSKAFNYGLYQILMYWFIGYEKYQIIPYSDLIREELLNLFIHDHEFIDTLTGAGTNSLTKLRKKFDIWGNTLKGILNYPENEPRAFSYSLKQQLFEKNPVCKICSQRIHTLDDAEVDHIENYWRGGKTIPENARLTHRYCNRSRKTSVQKINPEYSDDSNIKILNNINFSKISTELSPRKKGEIRRNTFVSELRIKGVNLFQEKGRLFKTENDKIVGIASANEKDQTWFLGLPMRNDYYSIVLLCEQTNSNTLNIILPFHFFQTYMKRFVFSNDEYKFHVFKKINDLYMIIPKSEHVNVTQFLNNYEFLR